MLDFLVFVTYLYDNNDYTYERAKTEATIVCEHAMYNPNPTAKKYCSYIWKNIDNSYMPKY